MEDEDSLEDPTRPSLARYAEDGHAFAIPWSQQPRTILQGLESNRFKDQRGPWMTESPFNQEHIVLSTILYDTDSNHNTYHDAYSTQSSSKTEHLSVSGGVTVGYPFLNASVHVDYDKCVITNENGVQASRQASCRLGRIMPRSSPKLSKSARDMLSKPGGRAEFRKRYGDYFVNGFELGADASACMTGTTFSQDISHSLAVTVAVKVLFFTTSYTHSESWNTSTSQATYECAGFSTLQGLSGHLKFQSPREQDLRQLHSLAQTYMERVASLELEVKYALKALGLTSGSELPLSTCAQVCRTGLVVQLLLAPYARLEEYARICRG